MRVAKEEEDDRWDRSEEEEDGDTVGKEVR